MDITTAILLAAVAVTTALMIVTWALENISQGIKLHNELLEAQINHDRNQASK